MWGPSKKLGRIGSDVLTFIGYKQTDRQATIRPKFCVGPHVASGRFYG